MRAFAFESSAAAIYPVPSRGTIIFDHHSVLPLVRGGHDLRTIQRHKKFHASGSSENAPRKYKNIGIKIAGIATHCVEMALSPKAATLYTFVSMLATITLGLIAWKLSQESLNLNLGELSQQQSSKVTNPILWLHHVLKNFIGARPYSD